jgi:hypothetical protein
MPVSSCCDVKQFTQSTLAPLVQLNQDLFGPMVVVRYAVNPWKALT